MSKLGQEPAFPNEKGEQVVIGRVSSVRTNHDQTAVCEEHNQYGEVIHRGMSKRLLLAGMAMQGILSTEYSKNIQNEVIVKMSLMMADELLKQEE